MKKRDQRTRVIKLLHILKRQTDEEHPLNATQLAAELLRQGVACDRKTIYADLAALEKEGYDIIYSHARPTGYFLASRLFERPRWVCWPTRCFRPILLPAKRGS